VHSQTLLLENRIGSSYTNYYFILSFSLTTASIFAVCKDIHTRSSGINKT